MSKKILTAVIALTIILVLGAYYFSPAQRQARFIDQLVEQNVTARGGQAAWRKLDSIRLTGQMDLGQDTVAPYTLEQKRPDKMRLEFIFNKERVIQSTDGKVGWKFVPFLGRKKPEPMTDKELREAADTADPYGLLFDYSERGNTIEYLGIEKVAGREAHKLKVTLPRGTVRWVFLDTQTALEIKVETRRMVRGKERKVETFYKEWKPESGLIIAHRQETMTEGDEQSHFLTVEEVTINPALDASHFVMPTDMSLGDTLSVPVS